MASLASLQVQSITLILLRLVFLTSLLIVIIWSIRGIVWLVWSPSKQENTIQVQAFDLVKGTEVRKGQGDVVAKILSAKMRRVIGILSTDLSRYAPTQPVLLESATPKVVQLAPDVSTRFDVEIKAFDFDVAGVVNYLSDRLSTGPVIHGEATITDKGIEVIAVFRDESANSNVVSSWTGRSSGSLDEALEDLAHQIVSGLHRDTDPQISVLSTSQFKRYVSALEAYQVYIRNKGSERSGALDQRLREAAELLRPIADESPSGRVCSYLASIYTLLNQPVEAKKFLVKAVGLNPNDRYASGALVRIMGVLVAQPKPAVEFTDVKSLTNQPAFAITHIKEAIANAGKMQSIKVAVISTGVSLPEPYRDRVLPGYNFVQDDRDTQDENGHGTSVSILVALIAPKAQILPVKVLDAGGTGDVINIIKGIDYAIEQGARIVILPLRWPENDPDLDETLRRARQARVLPVVAAGNDPEIRSGLTYSADSLVVAATNDLDELTTYTSRGNWVSLAAPGDEILVIDQHNYPNKQSGTSFSCTIVAGIAALVWSSRPELTDRELETILKSTARDISGEHPNTKGNVGAGVIDALAAVKKAREFRRMDRKTQVRAKDGS